MHHLTDEQLAAVFAGVHGQLTAGGGLLITTRPHQTDYPFFEAAHGEHTVSTAKGRLHRRAI